MNWKKLLENNSLQKKKISLSEVEGILEKANKCLKAAGLLLKEDVNESVFKEAKGIDIKFHEFQIKDMAVYNNLPVYKTSYDLLVDLFVFVKDFNREYKYTIGESIKKETIEMITNIYRARLAKGIQRLFTRQVCSQATAIPMGRSTI